jgi:hypothetical protein
MKKRKHCLSCCGCLELDGSALTRLLPNHCLSYISAEDLSYLCGLGQWEQLLMPFFLI